MRVLRFNRVKPLLLAISMSAVSLPGAVQAHAGLDYSIPANLLLLGALLDARHDHRHKHRYLQPRHAASHHRHGYHRHQRHGNHHPRRHQHSREGYSHEGRIKRRHRD